ncbi:dihydrolipoyl dehydrogenase [Candidatus Nomurabacteria bacterium]|nr:dihydrolipoyl dehydrogenase [Candidatus Nomurabacteria bacterium]
MKKIYLKILLVVAIIVVIYLFKSSGSEQYLTLETLKEKQGYLQNFYNNNPFQTIASFMMVYILTAALSLPGATLLTLSAGVLFGFWTGTVLVSFASTIGATLAFLSARFLFKETVQNKFRDKLEGINAGIKKDGAYFLFTLRLVPLFPFFLINLVMGLTPIRTLTYFLVSQIGMLPGTAVFVNAGTQLGEINSLKEILSFKLLLSFALVGLLPLISKFILDYFKSRKILRKYKKPKYFDYNVIVIGAGSAGLVSSYIAAVLKAKVALIEKHKMGGDCLNTGCVPSKALIRSSKILSYVNRAQEFGFNKGQIDFDFEKVMARIHRVIKKVAPHDSTERYSGLGVDCIEGEAKITSPYTVAINGPRNEKTLTTKTIIIATGARPLVPPILGLSQIKYLTSDNIWGLKSLPRRLVVLGGGPIGCELAQSFRRFGSEVTLVEMASKIMGKEDEDVSSFVFEKFKKEGVSVLTNHKAKAIELVGEKKTLVCEYNQKDIHLEFDEILIALGRKANVSGFGLEDLGVEITKRGTVVVDEFLRTNYPNIYVCGDVTGPYQFTHTASHQAWYASVNALFSPLKKFKVDYRVIPWCTFTDPEVARVGLSEQEARDSKIPFEITKYDMSDLDRAIADEEDHGFVKILTPPGGDKILGVTIVGTHAGDLIAEYVTAMKYGLGLNKILGTIHIYPTLAEANKYAAGIWKKNHAPQKILHYLSKFHEFRRRRST